MKQHKFYLSFSFILCLGATALNAQQITVEQAIEQALKNNYDIAIAKNESTKATNNNTLGNAGMLPKIDLNATGALASNATKQEFANGLIVDRNAVESKNITSGAYLTWTIFDGFKMFATHARLQELEKIGALNLKIQIENTIIQVVSAYNSIVMQKQIINGINENIIVSEERLKLAQKKLDIGSGSKVDVLQAKVDLNSLKSTLIRQRTTLRDAKANLNQLLLQPSAQEFDVVENNPSLNEYKYEELQNKTLSNNTNLIVAQNRIEVAKYAIREGKSLMYPKLNLNTNYIYSRAQNQAGFALLNQNLGLNIGFTASWTIFNGFVNDKTIKNLYIDFQNSTYEYEKLKALTQMSMYSAFEKNKDDIEVLTIEEENKKLAKENLEIALERFRLGVATSIELKVAQQSFEECSTRLAEARFNAKSSELQLLKLMGDVIK
ncbi:MAG: TolC family protein [Bacteroidia bacterium]